MSDSFFIQDPDRHFEKLPQPFAFIHNLVYSLLDSAYERLLVAETERAECLSLSKLTNKPINNVSIEDDLSFVDIGRVKVHLDGEDGVEYRSMLIFATRVHLLYFPVSCGYLTEDPLFQYKLPGDYPIQDIHVLFSSNRCSLIRCRDVNNRVEYHAITSQNSYRACSIPDDVYSVTSVVENESQIIITCSENEDLFLLIFSFPITQWRDVVQVILNSSQEDLESNPGKLINFTKPILLARINKPQPIQPSTFFHQSDLPHFSDTKDYMNGISHILTPEFFKNYCNHFHDRRPGHTSTRVTTTSVTIPLYTPHCNSVISSTVGKRDLTVWWEGGTDLYVYTITAPTKDIVVYPLCYMELVSELCSSCTNSMGDVIVIGFKHLILVWKFPQRHLIKTVTIEDDFTNIPLIQHLPKLGYSDSKIQFICVSEKNSHLLEITPHNENFSVLTQEGEPPLPHVEVITQLSISPINHYVLLHLANGVAVVRDIAADTPSLIIMLQPIDTHTQHVCSYLSHTDKQLYSVVTNAESKRLVQYDISPFLHKIIAPEIDEKPKPIPEALHSPKKGFFIPGDNSCKKIALDYMVDLMKRKETINKDAKVAWDKIKSSFPPPP